MHNATTNSNAQRLDIARGLAMMGSESGLRKILTTVVASLSADLPKIDAALQAGDGATALRSMVSFRPDLVLTDIHMQPMDGIAFVQQLRKHSNPMVKGMKVIFMSADASSETLGQALPLGTFGYIVKPPRPDTLKAKIAQALK